ncbi:MAG: glycosyltransferase family 2 protein [Actinomycetota bacterium]|nr:glycosyltransferase family 2 protein [Nitrospiraceae bacterium]MDA8155959.1 glycosyltransferase family 2 protein [Actinomycetota bacterium]
MIASIIIPVFNQISFTKICMESLQATRPEDSEIIIVNNGSSDETSRYLSECRDITVIQNDRNLGCAAAWNQGIKASRGQWIAILNNDIILSPGWLNKLLDFAIEKNADIVSPAFREGPYNYDIAAYSKEFTRKMQRASRMGVAQGICFMVKRRVFDRIGFFDENFKIGQYEDADFFRRAKQAGYVLGTTGRSVIHHFGSITQNRILEEMPDNPYEKQNRIYYRRKHHLTSWKRFIERRTSKLRDRWWSISEHALYGHTMVEKCIKGRLRYF